MPATSPPPEDTGVKAPRRLDISDEAASVSLDEELVRTVGKRFAGVFHTAQFGMALVGTDGSFLHANRAFCELTGRSKGELVAGGWSLIAHPEDLEAQESCLRRTLTGARPTCESETRYLHPDGREVWVLLSAALVADDRGRPLCFLVQAHDIGERRRAEAELARRKEDLQAADERKSRFVATASHELRTPLTSVLGFASMIRNHWDAFSEDQKLEYLGLIEEQAKRLSRLVADLLTISRIEGRTLEMRPETLEVGEAINQILSALGKVAADVRISGTNGLRVVADGDHLQQILVNFLDNALKYGAPPVEVAASDGSGWVEIRVRDQGDGVPPDFVPRLFESFTRADTPAARATTGTGLGLSIVRGLALAQGGDVWYEPNEPRGACFVVRLPAPPAH